MSSNKSLLVVRLIVTWVVLASVSSGCSTTGNDSPVEQSNLDSPLDIALGLRSERKDDLATFAAEAYEQELQIEACMKSEGFEYFPVAPEYLAGQADDALLSFGEYERGEWIERYGFGVTTTLFAQEDVPEPLQSLDGLS